MNIEELRVLGQFIAEALIQEGLKTSGDEWATEDNRDHIIGELARCVTLQNIYLDREEYEKCAVMKLKIEQLTEKLDIEDGFDPTDSQGDEEE